MKKIIVAGSLNYDIFVEAPRRPVKGETLVGYRWYTKAGGKGGNQAVSAVKNGCSVLFIGAVGNDHFADALVRNLERNHVDVSRLQRAEGTGSGMSVAIMDDDGDYGAVIVAGSNYKINNEIFREDAVWEGASLLILQNEVDESTNIMAAQAARSRGIKVCINAAPARQISPELKQLLDIVVVNEVEAAEFCSTRVKDLNAALEAARIMSKEFSQAVVTAGSAGVAYAEQHGECGAEPAHRIKVVSTHGAGDCFVGALCARLAAGAGLKESVSYANLKAAEHVSAEHPEYLI